MKLAGVRVRGGASPFSLTQHQINLRNRLAARYLPKNGKNMCRKLRPARQAPFLKVKGIKAISKKKRWA